MADEKILENEKLDDEQLEEVAGGYGEEITEDKKFFYDLGILKSPNASDDELKNAFAMYGIKAKIYHGHIAPNSYFLSDGGNRILNHDEVLSYIKSHPKK